jgi:tetratricopeptide (TPR) repeat protein
MGILHNLSTLALREVLEGACTAVGLKAGEAAIDGVVNFLTERFTDQSQRLPAALHRSNEHAWKALEIALAGESIWTWLDRAENKAFRQQVRAFLDVAPLAGLPGHGPEFRQQCLKELRDARKAGVLTGGSLDPRSLAQQAGAFARFADPQSLLDAEWRSIEHMAGELRQANYPSVAHLLALRPAHGTPVLVAAVRFFFRREVETDRELFQGLTWAKLEAIRGSLDHGFASLSDALAAHRQLLEEMLGSVQEVVVQTHGAVLDVQAEQQRQGQQVQEIYQAVLELKRRYDLQAVEVRPRDSLAIGSEAERRLVKQVLERFRNLPAEEQRRLPALLNSLAQLEVASGDFDAAQRDFQQVAALVSDRKAQAEAQHNAYGAALERGELDEALTALKQATALDPQRWAPFPLNKYEPERILGAGGFGVAFLCRNRHSGGRVVVKALRTDSLDREVADVFREAQVLEEIEHPAIIRLRDCDYADADQKRPYLVMDYFDGLTLSDYVEKHGALKPEELVAMAVSMAEALQAAHARGILHRDVKPANVLVRREGDGARWRIKLIDFGLALKQSVLKTTVSNPGARAKTIMGYSVAGTVDYAAPEQMGRLPGVAVGPYTDVYGFGKTCCHALFRTVQPLRKHWREIPEALADLLEQCLSESPEERLPNFTKVLGRLGEVEQPSGQPGGLLDEGLAAVIKMAKQITDVVSPASKSQPPKTPPERKQEWWRLPPGEQRSAEERPAASPAARPLVAPGGELRLAGHTDWVLSVSFSPDGRRLLTGSKDKTVRLWDVATGEEAARFEGHTDKVWSVLFTPDGRFIVSGSADRSVRLWDISSGRELRRFDARTNRGVALSPDGRLALTGSLSDGMVRLWELETGRELRRFKGHMSWVLGLAFSPDGRQGLSGSADGTLRLWEADSGREVRRMQGHTDQVLGVAYSPTGRYALSGSADRSVRLWDLRTGRQARSFPEATDQVWSVTFSPEGGLGSWEGQEGFAGIWDLESGQMVRRLKGHAGKVLCVAFAPDGRQLVTGSVDKTLIVWGLHA